MKLVANIIYVQASNHSMMILVASSVNISSTLKLRNAHRLLRVKNMIKTWENIWSLKNPKKCMKTLQNISPREARSLIVKTLRIAMPHIPSMIKFPVFIAKSPFQYLIMMKIHASHVLPLKYSMKHPINVYKGSTFM